MKHQEKHYFFNQTLANCFVLHTKLYRYQWYAKGKQAMLIQNICKQFQETIQQIIAIVVEHILTLDGKPFATMVKFIKEATLQEATADDEAWEIFQQLKEDFTTIINELEEKGTHMMVKEKDFYSLHVINQLLEQFKKMLLQCNIYAEEL